jgi:type II secretory pathway pseudopilin PulG
VCGCTAAAGATEMRDFRRAGVTLIELIVSIVLLLVVVAIGAIAARRTLAIQARMSLRDARASAMSDALTTLARHAATADPRRTDLRRARDTVLDVVHSFGFTSVCRVRGDTIVTTTDADSLPWSAVAPRSVTVDDEVRVWRDGFSDWQQRGIRAIGSASGACGDSTRTWPGRAAQRLVLSDSIGGVQIGALIRVLQRERWSLVRGGDGVWALSMATWDAARGAFQVPQPLLAPLAGPAAVGGAGFTVQAIDARGVVVFDSVGLASARSLIAVLRSPRHQIYGQLTDSVRINVGAH